MTYELAEELRKAGYPQTAVCPECGNKGCSCELTYPTLSELIDACGYSFHLLEKEPNTPDYWRCLTFVDGKEVRTKGYTPEEAVARLWIKLNK